MPLGKTPLEPKAVQRKDGSWLLDGMMSVDEFKEIFHLENLPGEKRDAFQTVGGFLFTQMGRLPSVSDFFDGTDCVSKWSIWMESGSTKCWLRRCKRCRPKDNERRRTR